MDRPTVQAWLDRYVRAWKTYDPAEIGELFAQDATYRYHPWDEDSKVAHGRDTIVKSWVASDGVGSDRDAEGTYQGRYEPFAVDGNRAVAVGVSTYWTDASRSAIRDVYHNVFLLEFDADGRCRSFSEVFAKQPKR